MLSQEEGISRTTSVGSVERARLGRAGDRFCRREPVVDGTENGLQSAGMIPKGKISVGMVAMPICSLLLMAALDYFTGQELVFSCAYLLPVAMTAWWFGKRALITMSIASGLTAFVVDEFDGYSYSHPAIGYWNAFTCFLISIVTGWILFHLRETLLERKAANEELREALEKLEASTMEIRKLQTGLQTICAWTNRIQVGDEWMTPDEFLSSQLHLKLTHGISPEAYREMARNLPGAA